jgi:hypothetical protein
MPGMITGLFVAAVGRLTNGIGERKILFLNSFSELKILISNDLYPYGISFFKTLISNVDY